jgi:hypothetical protein
MHKMRDSKSEFKKGLTSNFATVMGGPQTQTVMQDLNKYSKEMREDDEYCDSCDRVKSKCICKKEETTEASSPAQQAAIAINMKKKGIKSKKKSETKEMTGSGSSGAYSAPIFGGDNEFIKKSDKETPRLKEGLASGALGIDKVEATEATTSGSVGSYSTPAMWAKSTKKKDWGPSRKTQYPGGSFVQVKKKCTKFPYCNQGDINALKLSKNESVKEAIKNVSEKYNISENVIKTILEYEYSKLNAK